MSIINPEIVKIGNRCYRRNPFRLSFQNNKPIGPYEEETDDMFIDERKANWPIMSKEKIEDYESEEPCNLDQKCCSASKTGDECDEMKEIFETKSGYSLKIRVAECYIGSVIGRSGETKSTLEKETNTKIILPSRGMASKQPVQVNGTDKQNIISCRNRIILIISSARLRKPFTHILTLPLIADEMKLKFTDFKNKVLDKFSKDRGVDESIFLNVDRLHITICIAILNDKSEIEEAITLLDHCYKTFIKDTLDSKPLSLSVKGIEYMNDDPSNVDVLYAKISEMGGIKIKMH
jgi:activating signal cointegrator complex subunit 1